MRVNILNTLLQILFKTFTRLLKNKRPTKKVISTTTPLPTEIKPIPTSKIIQPNIKVKNPLVVNQQFLTSHNRPALQNKEKYQIIELKGIIVHWTANTAKGATAQANRNYFNAKHYNHKGKLIHASAHYVLDDKEVIQCLPDNEVGYHVGDRPKKHYSPIAYRIMKGHRQAFSKKFNARITPNYFLIGVEICVNDYANLDKALDNTYRLLNQLINKYNVPILRHYDITFKQCPKLPINEDMNKKVNRKFELLQGERWEQFKSNCINYQTQYFEN